MASRRSTAVPSSFKSVSTEAKSTRSGNPANKASNERSGRKTVKSSGTAVKSRYLQSAEKTSLSKGNSLTNESVSAPQPASPKPTSVKPKAGTPTRRSLAPQTLATSMSLLGKSVLQSTFSDNPYFRPELDISVIKDRTVIENAADISVIKDRTVIENAAEPERYPEEEKRMVEMQTFLLAYLTAKMESNTAKLKVEAEAKLLQAMEEEKALYDELKEKKQQYLLAEKKRLVNELLDLQIAALTPVAKTARRFTEDYKSFGTAIDASRHELPVKNFYIAGDRQEFLDKAAVCLEECENILVECTEGDYKDNSTCLECLRDMKVTSKNVGQQLSGTFKDLLNLSSLVCRHTVYVQQGTEEERLGSSRCRELYSTNK